ncbi:hypothetical protein SS50377_21762 [Spironucleus salmonicida]|uniref:Dynein regulatory complex subunit 7 C-terminal domain-containing protein n=1 Tax=Spironucleus salmonicida TaxID=348837 RepID=V6LNV6_9EUKA|nr:hypothetical protein SS50377_21762 [Spironucleus salmonicida]|eukprot:EST45401.1 hypothetical protein SS50377_14676 [Spironucleus salmonicida]
MKSAKIESLDPSILPASYTQNSERENLLLNYSAQFETAFLTNFPNRKPLFLSPQNEGKTHKFIPTFIKPAILPSSTLQSANLLSSFIARTTNYLPLENALLYPSYIQSPQTTLEWQSGDCYDLSILLASLLIGAGFNAHVVIGYADRRLTNQETARENCPEIPEFVEISQILADFYSSDIANSAIFKPHIIKMNHSYCKEINDFQDVETVFTQEQWILDNLQPCKKSIQNLIFRSNFPQNIYEKLTININLVHDIQLKNSTGFTDFTLLNNQIESKVAELRFSRSGNSNLRSEKLSVLGAVLVLNPNENYVKTSFLANKYLKPKPVIPVSEFNLISKIRSKMAKIGASELEIENFIINQMARDNKLDDILIPGKTGQKHKSELEKQTKSGVEKRKQRIQELSTDQLEGQRCYSWVYIEGITQEYEGDINAIKQQLEVPQNVKNGCFIDPASGRIFNVKNSLFKGIEAIFNDKNYFVNLQIEKNLQDVTYDFMNIESWCICLMNSEIVKIRQIQFNFVDKKAVQGSLVNQVGGAENGFLIEIQNAQSGIENCMNLPQNVVKNQEKLLQEQSIQQFNKDLLSQKENFADLGELQQDYLNQKNSELQKKYASRWDSVTPIRILISSLPVPWPVPTNLSEIKLENNFPLRKALEKEKITAEYVPEKTILYKDCFIRLFNTFSQRTGVAAIVQSRPRPVYTVVCDNEGDIIKNEISHWFITRISVFRSRVDGMVMRIQQFEVDDKIVHIEPNLDEFLRNNYGGELISKFDTETIEFNDNEYPMWCFIGEDLDELPEEEELKQIKFQSLYPIDSKLLINRFIFNDTREDGLSSHDLYENGVRKTIFYPKREDFLSCQTQHNNSIVQKFYDLLRLDGLIERQFIYNSAVDTENSITIPLSTTISGQFDSQVVNIASLTEKFRDLGSIQKTVTSRRRRLIEGKNIILNAEAQFIAGQAELTETTENEPQEPKKENAKIAFIENEDKIVNQDTFQELETSLTLASYNIYVANKQLFSSNIASVFTPKYSIQQGVSSLVKRHEDLLLMAYNLCPDVLEKKEEKEDDNLRFELPEKELNKSFSESEASQEHQEQETGIGIEFWLKKRTQTLKAQNSKETTHHLKSDLIELFSQKSGMMLPKGIASTDPSLNRLENIDSELRQNAQGYYYDYFAIDQYSSSFSLLSYLKLLKRRELPILPMHDSGKLAVSYMQMNMRDPQRYEQIQYNFEENLIRIVDYNTYPDLMSIQRLFVKQSGMCHFNNVYDFVSDIVTTQNIGLAKQLQNRESENVNKSKIRQPLGSIVGNATNNKIFQSFQQVPLADNEPQTSVLKVSEEFVFLSSREKLLHSVIYNDFQGKINSVDSVERNQETKLFNQTLKGLKFTPRDLIQAKNTLQNHGLNSRFNMRITPIQKIENQQSGTDFLDIFIPDEYKSVAILPVEISKKVLHDCMDAMRMRLVERSSIIQSRLEGETENLRRKKAVYNKSSEQLEISDREKILSEIRDSIFRIEILELRLQKHAQESAVRYVELEGKVKNDARMVNWDGERQIIAE